MAPEAPRQARSVKPGEAGAAPKHPSDEEVAEARKALAELVRAMARASAVACHKLGLRFDMDDPDVARDVMRASFEGLFLAKPGSAARRKPASKEAAPQSCEATEMVRPMRDRKGFND